MSTPICPKCGLYLYVCECLSEAELQFRQDMVERWYEYGCDDSIFGPDELEIIHNLIGGHRSSARRWDIQDDNSDAEVKVSSNWDLKNPSNRRTDVIVTDKSNGKHKHFTFDEYGNASDWHDWRK